MSLHNSIVPRSFGQPAVRPVGRPSQGVVRDGLGSPSRSRKNQAGSPRGKPAFLVVSFQPRFAPQDLSELIRGRASAYLLDLRPAFLSDRAGFRPDFFVDRLATFFDAFFGDRVVFLVAFRLVAISLAPRIEHPVRLRNSSPWALFEGKPQ